MIALIRTGIMAVLVACLSFSAFAADPKPFHRDDLADAAIKLEAQIKADAGPVAKPIATLRRDADAAVERRDYRGATAVVGQIIAVAPQEAANWLRLARTILQVRPANDAERAALVERAATAAYVA